MPSNKIVVLGGTFNPLSKAHGELIKYLVDYFDAFKGILLPTNDNFFHSWKHFKDKSILPINLRLKILNEFVKRNQNIEIELLEVEGKSKKTYTSLKFLSEKYPDNEILFAFGSEKVEELSRRYRIEDILNEYKIILIRRNHDNLNYLLENDDFLKKHKSSFIPLNFEDGLQDISSTKIRDALNNKNEEELKKLTYNYVIDILKEEGYL